MKDTVLVNTNRTFLNNKKQILQLSACFVLFVLVLFRIPVFFKLSPLVETTVVYLKILLFLSSFIVCITFSILLAEIYELIIDEYFTELLSQSLKKAWKIALLLLLLALPALIYACIELYLGEKVLFNPRNANIIGYNLILLLLSILLIPLYIRLVLSPVVVVLDNESLLASVKISWQLTGGAGLRIFVYCLAAVLIVSFFLAMGRIITGILCLLLIKMFLPYELFKVLMASFFFVVAIQYYGIFIYQLYDWRANPQPIKVEINEPAC